MTMRALFTSVALLAIVPSALADEPNADPILVIVRESSPIHSISSAELRRLFSQRGYVDEHGDRQIPVNLPPGHPTRVAFDQAVLDLASDDVGRFWIDQKIRGRTGPPTVVGSPDLVARFTRSVPNIVGYTTGPLPPGVRAVPVNGLSPDDEAYPLRPQR